MYLLATACEAIARTTKKMEKTQLVAVYLRSRSADEAAVSAVFLSGQPFPAYEQATLGVGGTQLWRAVQELSGKSEAAMTAAYRRHGDLGAAAFDILSATHPQPSSRQLNVIQVEETFHQIAAA